MKGLKIAFIFALMAILVLTACGGDDPNDNQIDGDTDTDKATGENDGDVDSAGDGDIDTTEDGDASEKDTATDDDLDGDDEQVPGEEDEDVVDGDYEQVELDPLEWTVETVDDGGDVGKFSSIAVDSNGHVHIAYANNDNTHLKYASDKTRGWETESIDELGGISTDIKTDSDGKVHISYIGETVPKYISNISGSWSSEAVAGMGCMSMESALDLDSDGNAYLLYFSGSSGASLCTNKSGNWVSETIGLGPLGDDLDIALHEDKIHISYHKNDYQESDLEYAFKDGDTWQTEAIATEGKVGRAHSLYIDTQGAIHIVYLEEDNGKLVYAVKTGSSWSKATVDSTGDVGKYNAMSGYEGHIVIAYYDATAKTLKYQRGFQGSWTGGTIDDSAEVGQYCSLDISSTGTVHVSYYDSTNGDLKHAQAEIE